MISTAQKVSHYILKHRNTGKFQVGVKMDGKTVRKNNAVETKEEARKLIETWKNEILPQPSVTLSSGDDLGIVAQLATEEKVEMMRALTHKAKRKSPVKKIVEPRAKIVNTMTAPKSGGTPYPTKHIEMGIKIEGHDVNVTFDLRDIKVTFASFAVNMTDKLIAEIYEKLIEAINT